ncbi:SDR family NAD(P)-dependent oxidoreductase [Flavobacterium luteum]|uniref:SDR family NAD(P)-dependent oxidoreductase n=1 Tax=Flavobacterium luteum TaxID=2026654 RepID=A0A7J5AJM9_9FLAO|nr:SDR family NAD(P)-dependent oxidoreductase [Flavobacterium luteum]KAB1157822.1 SDR family NAD(P)-dependent oxidoreductase [Flavobacterium luteum]
MKTIIITGGTSGIGLELVKYFAINNYEVIFTGRNIEVANSIISNLSNYKLTFFQTDFASFESIDNSIKQIKSQFKSIDILINNAGVWEMEFKETSNGIEVNFGVNHLATMLFTLKISPILNPLTGRIINTSSGAHRRNIIDLDDIEWRKKDYDGIATYSQSKLCNILFTRRLSKEVSNTNILVNTVHPGYVKTKLFNNMQDRNWDNIPDAFQGARSAIFAATDTKIVTHSNLYIYQEQIDPNITAIAQDDNLADLVWDLSKTYLNKYL